MKKNIYRILIICIISFIFLSITGYCLAVGTSQYEGITQIDGTEMGPFATFGGQIVYILQFVGYSVAVIMLTVMGIKYIMSSPNDKADIKSKLVPYIIGAVLLFAGSTMLNIIYNIATTI